MHKKSGFAQSGFAQSGFAQSGFAWGAVLGVAAVLSLVVAVAANPVISSLRQQADAGRRADTEQRLQELRAGMAAVIADLNPVTGEARGAERSLAFIDDGTGVRRVSAFPDVPAGLPRTAVPGEPADILTLPAAAPGDRRDGYGNPVGYCSWDPQQATDPLYAILSAGADRFFETSCADLGAGNAATGDDYVLRASAAEIVHLSSQWAQRDGNRGSVDFTSGNVGIGTDAPAERVDVTGDARVRGTASASGGATAASEVEITRLEASRSVQAEQATGATSSRLTGSETILNQTIMGDASAAPAPEEIPGTVVLRRRASADGLEYFSEGAWHELVQDRTTPTAFSFADRDEAPFNTNCLLSDVVTPEGSTEPGSIGLVQSLSHTTARYRLGSSPTGPWGSWIQTPYHNDPAEYSPSNKPAGVPLFTPGQSLQLCLSTGNDFDETRTATIAIGRYYTTWTVKTAPMDDEPDGLNFVDLGTGLAAVNEPGWIPRNSSQSSNEVTPGSFNQALSVSIVSGPASAQIRISNGAGAFGAWGTSGVLRVDPITRAPVGDRIQLRMNAAADHQITETIVLQVGSVTASWSVTSEPIDDLPDIGSFSSNSSAPGNGLLTEGEVNLVNGGHFGRWIQTGNVTPQNFNNTVQAAVASTGGTAELSINDGAWVSSGEMSPGDRIKLRMRAGLVDGETETATLTIGEGSANWTLATVQDVLANSFSFSSLVHREPLSTQASNIVTLLGFDGSLPVTLSGDGTILVNGTPSGTSAMVAAGDTIQIRTSAPSERGTKSFTLSVAGRSQGWSVASWYEDWQTGGWSSCSKACRTDGSGGTQSRSVQCLRSDGSIVGDAFCADSGAKPATSQSCNDFACSYGWVSSGWGSCSASPYWGGFGSCSATCGAGVQYRSCYGTSGTQYRSNYCYRLNDNVQVTTGYCTGPQPSTSQGCSSYCSGSSSQSCTGYSCPPVCSTFNNPSRVGVPLARSGAARDQFCREQMGSSGYQNGFGYASHLSSAVARWQNCIPASGGWCAYTGPDTERTTWVQCCRPGP